MMLRPLAAIAAAALVIVAASACQHGEGLDPSKMPENVRADYELFANRCSKCHSLARPLTANITDDEQWVLYVNRMRRQPGSGISRTDQDGILRFLRYYAADLRRTQAEKNGAPQPQAVPVLTPAPTASTAAPAPGASGSPVPATSPEAGAP
ncbi:MAG: hypothetical protein JWO86_3217 [Myxococcaceae bacterium]|nr:hypothetical protein [Myxococcaceae bacterium]